MTCDESAFLGISATMGNAALASTPEFAEEARTEATDWARIGPALARDGLTYWHLVMDLAKPQQGTNSALYLTKSPTRAVNRNIGLMAWGLVFRLAGIAFRG